MFVGLCGHLLPGKSDAVVELITDLLAAFTGDLGVCRIQYDGFTLGYSLNDCGGCGDAGKVKRCVRGDGAGGQVELHFMNSIETY